jgi:hypothetical protein
MITSIYLETSVIGAYLDKGESFRRDLTIRWWEHELKNYLAAGRKRTGADARTVSTELSPVDKGIAAT